MIAKRPENIQCLTLHPMQPLNNLFSVFQATMSFSGETILLAFQLFSNNLVIRDAPR